MFVIVVGGGNTGSQLSKFLIEAGHTVRIIDERPNVLEKLTSEIPSEMIINGDGSSPIVLERAGIQKAQVLAAVTGSDETNLVITSLARFEFNVPRVIARINQAIAELEAVGIGVFANYVQVDVLNDKDRGSRRREGRLYVRFAPLDGPATRRRKLHMTQVDPETGRLEEDGSPIPF